MIVPSGMVQPDRDLQYTLVEAAVSLIGSLPQVLERFVTVEELVLVELLDRPPQLFGRRRV